MMMCVEVILPKWTIAIKIDDAKTIAKFIYEYIITCFGCPKELVSDRNTHFLNSTIEQLINKWLLKHSKTTFYHSRANDQTVKINGILCKTITKIVQRSNIDWDSKFHDVLWTYRCSFRLQLSLFLFN